MPARHLCTQRHILEKNSVYTVATKFTVAVGLDEAAPRTIGTRIIETAQH